MPIVTLPDGSQKTFDQPVTIQDVAQSIGAGLANAALAGKINGKLVDTSTVLDHDVSLSIVTDKDPEGLEVLRHSCAHLLAQAVKSLFPEAQVTIGPVIEDGFYYDFSFARPFTPEDLEKIDAKMREIVAQNLVITRHEISRAEAIARFKAMGEDYKVQIIQDIPGDETLTFYQQGDFIDLCRGPHTPSTGKIKAFKLLKVAGAYWRGNAKNEMLQRIYGTAWANKKQLEEYCHRMEEAERRDHRKLAKKYDLFHMQEESPGMIFWHPKGWVIYQQIVAYIRQLLKEQGYDEVNTPQLVDVSLWEKSGHLAMFHQNMFSVKTPDDKTYAIKPMNCPCHIQIFNQGMKSYRDLPLRLAEFGSCHRNEPSGALHGIMRTRNFVQDDAHIFCTPQQLQAEVSQFIDLLFRIYRDFGFNEILIRLSTRPEQRVGSDEMWDQAEAALAQAIEAKGLAYDLHPGEGAFYGPKIEFSLKDCIGRIWQCGTIQVDPSMPERLGASYIAEDGSRQTPMMLHRAALGSLERFIGILIEGTAGDFPVWLAPIQVAVLNITDQQAEFVADVCERLKNKGFRAIADLRNEKIGFKIREHTVQRIPYLLVVGDREVAQQTLSVRTREGKDLGVMTVDEFVEKLNTDISKKTV